MSASHTAKAYTVALVGDLESSAVYSVTAAVASAVHAPDKVVSGDYLDRKSGSDKGKLFHIGCYTGDSLIDLINCPLSLKNVALALNQADRIAWVIQPDSATDNLKRAIAASAVFGVLSHLIVVNTGGLDADLKDPELLEVMVAEIQDLFDSQSVTVESSLTVDVDTAGTSAIGVEALKAYFFEKWLSPRMPVGAPSGNLLMGLEQCYGVSGPSGKSTRVGYGPVRGKSIEVGQSLTLVGVGGRTDEVRVSEVQEFGEGKTAAVAGSSAAILFHAVPKDRPKAGDVLTDRPDFFKATDEISVDLSVLSTDSAAHIVGSLKGADLCIGMASVSCTLSNFVASDSEPHKGKLSMRCQTPVPAFVGQPVMVGNGSEILAWGVVTGVSRNG